MLNKTDKTLWSRFETEYVNNTIINTFDIHKEYANGKNLSWHLFKSGKNMHSNI